MKIIRQLTCFIIALLVTSIARGQLTVTPNNNAVQLVNTLAGPGVTISNVTMNCPPGASGLFNGAATNLGIASGVLLTSGSVTIAPGPNNSSSAGQSNNVTFSDPQLIAIDPTAMYDPCIIEFDVVPSCSTLAFKFAFGSDEYHDYVNTSCNDAFGIFLTGPNPSGPPYNMYNMALIPATTTPISINTVNNGNSFNCLSAGPCTNCTWFVDNCNGPTIQYDGFTKPIPVSINVVPCQKYHFKLAIADACDWIFDSGVFFELQSLACNPPPLVATNTVTPALCSANNGSATVSITGGTPPYTYSWNTNPPQTTATATGLAPGNYIVTVIDATGCFSVTDTATITGGGGFTANTTQVNVLCFGGNNGSATANVTGGLTPYTYAWSPSGGNAATANNLIAGNYTCIITDAAGCSSTQTVAITEPPQLTSTMASQNVSCNGANNGSATITVGGGSPQYQYSWTPGGGNTANITGLGIGNYVVTVTDANGCTITNSVAITQAAPLAITSSQNNINCFGNINGSATVTVTGGNNPYTYAWSTNPPQVNPSLSGVPAGSYTCLVSDASGCTMTHTLTITQPPQLTGSITGSTNVSCFGGNDGSATAAGNGGTPAITYLWNSTPAQSGPIASGLTAGNYIVTIVDGNSCSLTQSVTITQPAGMNLTTTSIAASCLDNDGTATVSASGGSAPYSYLWLTSPVQNTATATGLSSGPYNVVVTDANGCAQSIGLSVGGTLPPVADFVFTPDGVINLLDPSVTFTDLSSSSTANWNWNFGDPGSGAANQTTVQHPYHIFSDTGIYCITLTISDPTGNCTDTAVKCLRVEAPYTFYIPNAFTPNLDGKNEVFLGYGTQIKEFNIMIFDRWGNKIFESDDITKGWNGKVKQQSGDLVQEDVYVWKVQILDKFGVTHKYIGHVTMVK